MPVALMEELDRGTSSLCGSDAHSPHDWAIDQPPERVCQRRQRNRDAARRSRKKQTERADVLHEELQTLETSNAAYVKEIAELKKELQHYTTILKEHEPHCTVQCLPGPSVPFTASTPSTTTSDLTPTFDSNPIPEVPVLPLPTPEPGFCLVDLLERNEWLPWDSMDM
ncbi:basic leucine zipper transcriptional factor ATF-like 3 [Pygocentrus nattereri]|uniref:basic leucine zipper transcriptional factor ATF-like 3 n=1 Tax=Pygocentrus nattereri TaxID=42514 RepID=UPI00081425C9|nr:basic leucine zipper transcriptional factor ATF-like 3 [Pygocentrus nattereri]